MSHHACLTCVLALSAAALSAQTTPVVTTVQTTPIVGIAAGQTARLNILNPGVLPPATGVTCTAAVAFLDGNGTVLKSTSLSVAPGTNMGFNLRSDTDLQLVVPGDRREIRATITIPAAVPTTTGSAELAPSCKVIPTLELFDSLSGQTQLILGRADLIPAAPTTTN